MVIRTTAPKQDTTLKITVHMAKQLYNDMVKDDDDDDGGGKLIVWEFLVHNTLCLCTS